MNEGTTTSPRLQTLGVAIATATAVTTSVSWALLVLLTGSMIPRATLVGAVLATALAVCAYRAVRAGQPWVLLMAATFGAVTPPAIGNAPAAFRYLGFLAIGYAIAAMLLVASSNTRRRVG